MRCRGLLAATGTALTTAVAGCGEMFGGTQETVPDSPDGAAEAYVRALVNGNTDRTGQLAHPQVTNGVTADSTDGKLTSIDTEVVDEDFSPVDVDDYEETGIVADLNRVE